MTKIFLIAGFLGSGKTTLVRHLLQGADLTRTAILVNEFGKIGIDGDLLADLPLPVVELANGCICCSMRYGLTKSLEEIIEQYNPERIVVEASGVADPRDIIQTIHDARSLQDVRLGKTITVLGADLWQDRDMFGPVFMGQVLAADLLLLNKVDLFEANEITSFLDAIRRVNPMCELLGTDHCRVSPDLVWGALRGDKTAAGMPAFFPSPDQTPRKDFTSFSYSTEVPFKAECFQRFVHHLPGVLYRIKGFARLEDHRVIFQYSHGEFEWSPTVEQGPTKLTFIGENLNKEHIIARLQSCLRA